MGNLHLLSVEKALSIAFARAQHDKKLRNINYETSGRSRARWALWHSRLSSKAALLLCRVVFASMASAHYRHENPYRCMQLAVQRIVRCGGAVDDDMANLIVAQLLYLDAQAPDKDITLYINSPGGSVTAGMFTCLLLPTILHTSPGTRHLLGLSCSGKASKGEAVAA